MKITIIGNKTDPTKEVPADGGRLRVRLYYNLLKEEGYDVNFIELEGWKKRFFSIIKQIKKAVNEKDIILLMGGPRGSRPLVYLCNYFNKNKKSRLVFSMLGIGTLDKKIKKLSVENAQVFLMGTNNFGISDKKMGKQLAKFDLVLTQNKTIANCYRNFYNLSNVEIMINFRYFSKRPHLLSSILDSNNKRFVFYSRVNNEKGVLEVMKAFKRINSQNNIKYYLDIYGPNQLTEIELTEFNKLLDERIVYKGILENSLALEVLKDYDFMVFPTKYYGEGTPASLIESFLAGLPIISSNYSQAAELIKEGKNGFLFEFNNYDSLIDILKKVGTMSTEEHNKMKEYTYNIGSNYTYAFNRNTFLYYVTGIEIKN